VNTINCHFYSECSVPNGGSEGQRHQRLYDDLRKKLLDLSRRNPMLNYKHRAGSRRQLRVVNISLESVFAELTTNQRELVFVPLAEPDDIPADERTDSFAAALGHAKSTDLDYLTRLAALDAVARQDDARRSRNWNDGSEIEYANSSNCLHGRIVKNSILLNTRAKTASIPAMNWQSRNQQTRTQSAGYNRCSLRTNSTLV
jgi:Protein of unknown function (DUF4011)